MNDDPLLTSTDPALGDRRLTVEQLNFFQQAVAVMEVRKYKANWPKVAFKDKFGFWPNLKPGDVVPQPAEPSFLEWLAGRTQHRKDEPQNRLAELVIRYGIEDADAAWLADAIQMATKRRGTAESAAAAHTASETLAAAASRLVMTWQGLSAELRRGGALKSAERLKLCSDELSAVLNQLNCAPRR